MKKAKSPKQVANTLQEVVSIPFEKVKREWIFYFNEIEKKLEKAKKEWNEFESEARSLFQTWYHSTFSKELSALREIEDESNQVRRTLEAIDAQMEVNSLTKRQAHQKVKAAMAENRDPFPSDQEVEQFNHRQKKMFVEVFSEQLIQNGRHQVDVDRLDSIRRETVADAFRRFGEPRNDREAMRMNDWINDEIIDRYEGRTSGPGHEEGFHSEDELFKSLFGDVFEEMEMGGQEDYIDEHSSEESFSSSGSAAHQDYKTLYRQIVRLLHPDRGSEMNGTEKELWSQAQSAYRSRDHESLRAILLRIEGGGKIDVYKLQTISDIQRLTGRLYQEYHEINFIKGRVKKDPVYRFWASRKRPANRKKLEAQIESELRTSLHYQSHRLKDLRDEMERLERGFSKVRARG